jgi:hypothetical protein
MFQRLVSTWKRRPLERMVTKPHSSDRNTEAWRSSSLRMTSGCGWRKMLSLPAEINANSG